jgi:cytochrome c biogenesis protein CcmG/thiol:disulfide interchange protein DsbE
VSGVDQTPLDEVPPGETAAPSRRWIMVAPLMVFAVLAALFMVQLFGGNPATLPSVLIGKPAPTFSLPPLEGLARDGAPVPGLTGTDLKGGVTVVNVWASWCAPCREEHPLLGEVAAMPGVRLVGINYKDQPENARRFLGALGNPFAAVGVDVNGRAAIDWGVYGVPETFVIAPDGTIAHKHIGPLTEAALKGSFREAIARAAAKRQQQ